jgi:hypothetical protein
LSGVISIALSRRRSILQSAFYIAPGSEFPVATQQNPLSRRTLQQDSQIRVSNWRLASYFRK